jgi:two-component system cell cycle response regulator DivK
MSAYHRRYDQRLRAVALPKTPPSGTFAIGAVVLLADDSQDSRELYATYLRDLGYSVVEVADGDDAVKVAQSTRPDLIVMDLSMPVVDGWEATRRLKRDADTRTIPLVALTGCDVTGHDSALAAGCDAYLVKPCLPEDLAGVVGSMLARRRLELQQP